MSARVGILCGRVFARGGNYMVHSDTFFRLPTNKATKLSNVTCVYCGRPETDEDPLTDEHVVSRNFVPKGSFVTGWSLILRACDHCNNEKSDLEDDISAITLLPAPGTAHEETELAQIAAGKAAGSFSRRTKKPVSKSCEQKTIKGKLTPGLAVSVRFEAPPQIHLKRIQRLAWFHLQGFWYFITYDECLRTGGFIPGEIAWLNYANRLDWGNSLQRSFADLAGNWDALFIEEGAGGYFKIALREDPSGAETWSVALEWNRNLRIIGFFGDHVIAKKHADALAPLQSKRINATYRMREQVTLNDNEDWLFAVP